MNRPIKAAAVLLWCYAALLVVEAVAVGVGRDWTDKEHLVRHILGALGVSLLAWAVLQGRRWAWLVVVIVGGALNLLGLASLLFLSLLPVPLRRALINAFAELFQLGSLSFPLFFVSLAVLAGSVAMLLRREARDAFFPRGERRETAGE